MPTPGGDGRGVFGKDVWLDGSEQTLEAAFFPEGSTEQGGVFMLINIAFSRAKEGDLVEHERYEVDLSPAGEILAVRKDQCLESASTRRPFRHSHKYAPVSVGADNPRFRLILDNALKAIFTRCDR